MENLHTYQSFNKNKSIKEMQYNLLTHKVALKGILSELHFYSFLLDADIYKPKVMNLFETLTHYKKDVNTSYNKAKNLLHKVSLQAIEIGNKIECDDLACENYFIKKQNDIEHKVYEFSQKMIDLKFRISQYLEGVIIN